MWKPGMQERNLSHVSTLQASGLVMSININLAKGHYKLQIQFSSVQLLSHVWLFATPWTAAQQAPLSMEFTGQQYSSVLPFPSPGDLPDPGIELTSFNIACISMQGLYHYHHLGSPHFSNQFTSVAQSCPTLQPQEPQHARPPGPSPTPWVYPNSCPLSHWCHPTISSSVIPFSSCPQSFPAWGSFPMSQLFASGGQSIGVSDSTSVLPMNIQDWSHLGLTGWISLQSKGLSRVFSNTTVQRHQFFSAQLSL